MKNTSLRIKAGPDLEVNLRPGKILEKGRDADRSLILLFAAEGEGAPALVTEGMKCVLREGRVTRREGAIRKVVSNGGRLLLECRFAG